MDRETVNLRSHINLGGGETGVRRAGKRPIWALPAGNISPVGPGMKLAVTGQWYGNFFRNTEIGHENENTF